MGITLAAAASGSRALFLAALVIASGWLANVAVWFRFGTAPLFEIAVAGIEAALFAGLYLRRILPRTFAALFWSAAALAAAIAATRAFPLPLARFVSNRAFDLLLLIAGGAAFVRLLDRYAPHALDALSARLNGLRRIALNAFAALLGGRQ